MTLSNVATDTSSKKPAMPDLTVIRSVIDTRSLHVIIIIIIIIIKEIYRVQDRPKASSALCQQWKLSTV